jgi:hypothetical protein
MKSERNILMHLIIATLTNLKAAKKNILMMVNQKAPQESES